MQIVEDLIGSIVWMLVFAWALGLPLVLVFGLGSLCGILFTSSLL